jgi:hypothetical protein
LENQYPTLSGGCARIINLIHEFDTGNRINLPLLDRMRDSRTLECKHQLPKAYTVTAAPPLGLIPEALRHRLAKMLSMKCFQCLSVFNVRVWFTSWVIPTLPLDQVLDVPASFLCPL